MRGGDTNPSFDKIPAPEGGYLCVMYESDYSAEIPVTPQMMNAAMMMTPDTIRSMMQ